MPLVSPILAMLVALSAPEGGGAGSMETLEPAEIALGEGEAFSSDGAVWPDSSGEIGNPVANQVRIEQRVILRISPQPGRLRRDYLTDLPQQALPQRLVERPFGDCLKASDIVGVADRDTRLLMFMRNRQIISAELEDACSPRDFYLGFYVEKNSDGKLCVDRDRLLSRAGAKCRISNLSRLVAVSD